MSIDPDAFRRGMGRLAASVCIITTAREDGLRWGATATAVCSVSADPPTLLCCLNRRSNTHDAIRDSGRLAVNVVASSDWALADRFASSLDPQEKFLEGLWTPGETGAPLLRSAVVSFDCLVVNAVDVGTHGIFFGDVVGIEHQHDHVRSLLYAGGGYGRFADTGEPKV